MGWIAFIIVSVFAITGIYEVFFKHLHHCLNDDKFLAIKSELNLLESQLLQYQQRILELEEQIHVLKQ